MEVLWKPNPVLRKAGDVTPDAGAMEGKGASPQVLSRTQDARILHTWISSKGSKAWEALWDLEKEQSPDPLYTMPTIHRGQRS